MMVIACLAIGYILRMIHVALATKPDDDYSEDIPGKYHVIEKMPDGSERYIGWFIEIKDLHYLLDNYPNSRAEKTTYRIQ